MIKINNKLISKEHKKAVTSFQKMLGLMFKTKVKKPLLFIFKKEDIVSLHMLFVFTPIDVIFMNKNKIIVELKQHFLPFTFYVPKHDSQYILETKPGTIKGFNIEVGQKVSF